MVIRMLKNSKIFRRWSGRGSLRYDDNIVSIIRNPLLILDETLRVISANRYFYETFKIGHGEINGRFIHDLGDSQWDIPQVRQMLGDILSKGINSGDLEVEHNFSSLGRKVMLVNARKIYNEKRRMRLILLMVEDVTEQKLMQSKLAHYKERVERLQKKIAVELADEINNPLMIISGSAELSLMEQVDGEKTRRCLETIVRECQLIKKSVGEFLNSFGPEGV